MQKLWERYFVRLVRLAWQKLQATPRRVADEEDVALSAFDSFCRAAEQGRFPELNDRDNLWALMVTIVVRKAYQLNVHHHRQKRGGKLLLDEAALERAAESGGGLAEVLDREPTPEMAAQLAEEYRQLLELLPGDELRSVAQWKLEGYTNADIAARLGCVSRSVERKLRVIRSVWSGREI